MGHNTNYFAILKTAYVVSSITHIKTTPIRMSDYDWAPGTSMDDMPVTMQHAGGPPTEKSLFTAIDEWLDLIAPMFNTGVSILAPEVWMRANEEDDFHWVSTFPDATAGTAGGASVLMMQTMTTFRTSLGGIYRDAFLENTLLTVNLNDPFPIANATFDAYADYVLSVDGSWIIGRDGGYAAAGIRLMTKTNDSIRRKRLLFGG